jgi:hypothetical protein
MAGIEKWGPQIDTKGLTQLYAPQEVRPFTATPAGIDNLALSSIDTFLMPDAAGKHHRQEVAFDGYFQVARAAPSTHDWATAEFSVNMTDIVLHSKSDVKEIGPMRVRLNQNMVSAGQVFAAGGKQAAAACRIAASVVFEAPQKGMAFFNKEPILLMNGAIKSVPPVEDPNGKAHIYLLPLFDMKQPDGRPVAYLESLVYTVGNYLSREAAEKIRARR